MAEKGDMKGAASRWEEATKLMPELFEASYNLARAKIELGLYDDAQKLVEKLIKEKPQEAVLYTLLGTALLGQGTPDDAISMHRKALSLDPDLYEARLNIARTYETVGNLQRALYEYNKIKKSAPNDPYLYLSIGSLYQSLGNEEKAMENFNKALEVSTDETVSSAVRAKLEALEAEKGLSQDALSEKLAPAIVQVQAVKIVPHPQFPQTRTIRQASIGAGFIVSGREEVITSAKLISKAAEITVRFYDPVSGTLGKTAYPAEVVVSGRIPSVNEVPFLDFALLKMSSSPQGLQALEFGDSSSVSIDDVVYTMGYPGGKEHKLLKGTVTEIRDMPGSEQQRMAFLKRYPAIKASPVKSVKLLVNDLGIDEQLLGAPLVNKRGQIIGINVVGLQGYEGESVALDINSVRTVLQR
jgi:S1-C subfamily serine protease